MFDPMTVVIDIKYPWRGKASQWWPKGYRGTVITIWHKDPCRDGTDDSCDWFGHKKKLPPKLKALGDSIWSLETTLDNRPFYPDHSAHVRYQEVKRCYRALRVRSRFRCHPRWHFWHWRIQIHPLQDFKRWAFSHCCKCGGRFKFGESVTSTNWSSSGPLWFRSQKFIYHSHHDSVAATDSK